MLLPQCPINHTQNHTAVFIYGSKWGHILTSWSRILDVAHCLRWSHRAIWMCWTLLRT